MIGVKYNLDWSAIENLSIDLQTKGREYFYSIKWFNLASSVFVKEKT